MLKSITEEARYLACYQRGTVEHSLPQRSVPALLFFLSCERKLESSSFGRAEHLQLEAILLPRAWRYQIDFSLTEADGTLRWVANVLCFIVFRVAAL